MNKIFIYGLVILILMVTILFIDINLYTKNNNKINNEINNKEKFLTINNDPDNDGKMRFDYLNNPNYKNNILSRYYVDDDKKINGSRIVQHPYQNSYLSYSQGALRKHYGNLYWNPSYSDYIYKSSGIRL